MLLFCCVQSCFFYGCYKKVGKYFSDKAIQEKEYDERIKKMLSQAEKYPEWHEQSIKIRKDLSASIGNLDKKMDKLQKSNDEGMAMTWRYRILGLMMKFAMTISTQKSTSTRYLKILRNMRNIARITPILKTTRRFLQ